MTTETAILAGGCFWCTEAVFNDVVGVTGVESGYIGGHKASPTYKEVCTGNTGHAEAVRVTYDPAIVSRDEVLDMFMGTHDPSQLNRQGNDVGTQYRSAIFPVDDAQRAQAEAFIARLEADRVFDAPIVTTIEAPGTWYAAEAYHQRFFERNPWQGYCMAVVAPKVAKFRRAYAARLKKR